MRDRTRMEEMGKAKNKAEGEKNVFKHMLEQAHERWLRERQELFRDALNKVDADATLQPRAPSLPPRAPSPCHPYASISGGDQRELTLTLTLPRWRPTRANPTPDPTQVETNAS